MQTRAVLVNANAKANPNSCQNFDNHTKYLSTFYALSQPINDQFSHGFYMMGTLVVEKLK